MVRPDVMGVGFLISGVLSFNAGLWQISRRSDKIKLQTQHKNATKPPLTQLPPSDESSHDFLFRHVELEGTFDNEGTELVGPRAVPSYRGSTTTEEAQGGYLLMTPFQLAGSDDIVMVNRGFVPIDAGKHRIYRCLYTGEGFGQAKVRGLLRREELLQNVSGIGTNELNFKPLMEGFAWMGMRPYEMAKLYYGRRWGKENVEERAAKHGLHRYHIEMIEDFSGNDQRMVRDFAWPKRRDLDEMTYVSMLPLVHASYAMFWFFCAGASVVGIRSAYRLNQQIILDNKRRVAALRLGQAVRDESAPALLKAQQEVQARQAAAKVAAFK